MCIRDSVAPVDAGRNVGGDVPDVVVRIRSTFSAKKVHRSSVETPSQARRLRPRSRSTVDHMSRGLAADVNLLDLVVGRRAGTARMDGGVPPWQRRRCSSLRRRCWFFRGWSRWRRTVHVPYSQREQRRNAARTQQHSLLGADGSSCSCYNVPELS